MNKLGDTIGKICEKLLPISEEFYIGNPNSSICICTLSSIKLLKEIKNSEIIDKVAIVGRLFTENKGIDSMIKHVNQNKKIKTIIVCGKEVWGHKSGHSLIQLYQNGIDDKNRITINTIKDIKIFLESFLSFKSEFPSIKLFVLFLFYYFVFGGKL